ncbi:hypothetical protein J4H86_06730 [Spiractinospora alimapuensis]|uniref:hypothetical protein n=1 Tax=Spiractinospora alimapuensis TaxID=2820884 RepID=UPI001F19ADC9|nr:hypothetical protein [Spiractinospora alimapuensis]QVQ53447.1 hypothetical protein J4H86_06730 [Spiractinospora alimapuensis]
MIVQPNSLVVAQSQLENAGSAVIGIIVGFGIVLAVLSIIVIALKMASANFQRHTRWASRGVEEIPWVLLGVCLLLLTVPIVTVLLSGATQSGVTEWNSLVEEQLGVEAPATPETPETPGEPGHQPPH